MSFKINYRDKYGSSKGFTINPTQASTVGLKSFKDVIDAVQGDDTIRDIYYPGTLYNEHDVVNIFNSVLQKMCQLNATIQDIQMLSSVVFMKGDSVFYPADLIEETINTKNYPEVVSKFKKVIVEGQVQEINLKTMDIDADNTLKLMDQPSTSVRNASTASSNTTMINWGTLIYGYTGDGEQISYTSAAATILSWLFTQMRITGKSPAYIKSINEDSSLVSTPVKLNPQISARFLCQLFKMYSQRVDVIKYFQRAGIITANYAYVLMIRNTPAYTPLPLFNFWAVSVKYHEMAAYNLYYNALNKWNKTDLDMIRVYYTPDAMEFYHLVSQRSEAITTAPYFYTYASWFVESYLAEFSLRRFPLFSYVCWSVGQKAHKKPDSTTIPGMDLYTTEEDYMWEVAREIMNRWSMPDYSSTSVTIETAEGRLEVHPMESIQNPRKRQNTQEDESMEVEEGIALNPKQARIVPSLPAPLMYPEIE